jgi:NDP-sugar pyrophosphorylase family protein
MKRPVVAILAGGLGTRLRPLIGNRPKCMVEIGGMPLLYHLISLYQAQGFDHVHLCLGLGAEAVIGEVLPLCKRVTFTVESEPLGTAGCIKVALDYLGNEFVVALGDSYTPEPVWPHYRRWISADTQGAMMVLKNQDVGVISNVTLDESGLVSRYEKHAYSMGWEYVDYGISFLRSEIIQELPIGFVDLGIVFQGLAQRHQLTACVASRVFWEVGTADSLARARAAVHEGRLNLG